MTHASREAHPTPPAHRLSASPASPLRRADRGGLGRADLAPAMEPLSTALHEEATLNLLVDDLR